MLWRPRCEQTERLLDDRQPTTDEPCGANAAGVNRERDHGIGIELGCSVREDSIVRATELDHPDGPGVVFGCNAEEYTA